MAKINFFATLLLANLLATLLAGFAQAEDAFYFPAIQYIEMAPDQAMVDPTRLMDQDTRWQSSERAIPNFGYTDKVYWLKFDLKPADLKYRQQDTKLFIEVEYPMLDHVDFYLFHGSQLIAHQVTGDTLPFAHRPLDYPSFLFPVTLHPNESSRVLFKVSSAGAVKIPIRVWTPEGFIVHKSKIDQGHAAYFGILGVVIIFNLFVFAALREKTYLFYALSTSGYLLLIGGLRGSGFAFVWPDSPAIQQQVMLAAVPFTLLFATVFARSFLKIDGRYPWINRCVLLTIWVNAILLLLSFVLSYALSTRLSMLASLPTSVLLMAIGPLLWYRGNSAARFYTLAWAMLTIGSVLAALLLLGLVEANFLTEYAVQIGSALEVIILNIALVERLYREREERMQAQDARIKAMAERRQAELKLMQQALHHPVTGLPNRASFEMTLKDFITREARLPHAICVMQVNNYAMIHKTLGHSNTDRLLSIAAKRINMMAQELPGIRVVEQSEQQRFFVASLDSGAFAFILDARAAQADWTKLSRCLEVLREPIDFLGMQVALEPVSGIALYPDHSDDPSTLIRQAYIAQDTAQAREQGMLIYQPALDSYNADRLTLVSDLKRAIKQHQLRLYYQPKLCLKSNQVVGLEALLRWPEKQQQISVDNLILAAEQSGLIKPITRWLLQQALQMRDRLLLEGLNLNLSINISPNNLREADFLSFVRDTMQHYPRHKGKILLELTESSMMRDPQNALQTLNQLATEGFPVSIDDFGSGYSSLSYIKQLPATEVKIDRSLIKDLTRQQEDRIIVQTTIDMCHSLGYQVVAEGVEDEETLLLLDAMGCDMIQGFLISKPLPPEDIIHWLLHAAARAGNQ